MENKSPLSPHLQIYRWHISSLVSISHRITGIINFVALILICIWTAMLLLGEANYSSIEYISKFNIWKIYCVRFKPGLLVFKY
jgi:succinate dehydrogenase / fumarate reductase cytochrome b subunit